MTLLLLQLDLKRGLDCGVESITIRSVAQDGSTISSKDEAGGSFFLPSTTAEFQAAIFVDGFNTDTTQQCG
jgi:hypothetical protein